MLDIMIIRTLFNKGSRVPLRGKVNEAVTTGVRVVDTILPIGRVLIYKRGYKTGGQLTRRVKLIDEILSLRSTYERKSIDRLPVTILETMLHDIKLSDLHSD